MGSQKGGGNQYIQLAKALYHKKATSSKQLLAFPLEVKLGFELQFQRWETSVLPLCHLDQYKGTRHDVKHEMNK